MKIKVMLLVGLFLILSNVLLISAGPHPLCNPKGNSSIKGVFINGACYNCGDADEVCPLIYGANCGSEEIYRDVDCVYTETRFWSLNSNGGSTIEGGKVTINVIAGLDLYLVITETGLLAGTEVTFEIRDKNFIGFDLVDTITAQVDNTSGKNAIATWHIEDSGAGAAIVQSILDSSDGFGETAGDEPFYFVAYETDREEWHGASESGVSNNLKISITFGGVSYETCADYTTFKEDACEADIGDVGDNPVVVTRDGCNYGTTGYCAWYSQEDKCIQMQSNETVLNEDAEACTNPEPRAFPCSYPNEVKIGSCADGDEFFKVRYSAPSTQTECASYETQLIPCPETLKLPFFGLYGIVMSLSLISLVYFFYRKEF